MTTKKKYGLKDLERKFGPMTVGRFLTAWRKAEGLSQRDFAKVLDISPANLCDIEKGRKGIGLYKATEIAKRIGYSPTVLVEMALQELLADEGLEYTVQVKRTAA